MNKINTDGLDFSTPLNQIAKFEHKNIEMKDRRQVNLLLVSNGEKTHYCCMKSLSRLLNNLTKHNAKSYYRNFWLQRFSSEITLNKHGEIRQNHDAQSYLMVKINGCNSKIFI